MDGQISVDWVAGWRGIRSLSRPGNLTAISVMNLALQAVMHVVAQTRISHQFRRLRSLGNQFRLPLRG